MLAFMAWCVSGAVRYRPSMGSARTNKPCPGHSRNEEEIALMKTIKKALDPKGILTPGKLL
jgi:FAD/FMN-containing dehydrogenase